MEERRKEEIESLEVQIKDLNYICRRLDNEGFFNMMMNPQLNKLREQLPPKESWVEFIYSNDNPPNLREFIGLYWVNLNRLEADQRFAIDDTIQEKRSQTIERIKELNEELQNLLNPQSELTTDGEGTEIPAEYRYIRFMSEESLEAELEERMEEIKSLEKELETIKHKEIRLKELPKPRQNRSVRKGNAGAGFSPEDLRNMEFDLIDLDGQGELGEFLGQIESRGFAIALIGDPTAGKSTFSFRLAKLFLDIGKSVKYFSLEEGVTRLTSDKLERAGIEDGQPFEVAPKATLSDIRKQAGQWDVIVVDSWSVLDTKPEEYNKLRSDFPQTIFIVIFQKTTGGTIRGGTKIIFDTPMCMNVYREGDERLVHMQKSRYGTQDWIYSITDECLVSDGRRDG